MTTLRMKSREARDNWRETLRHVENGGTVVIEHYNRPIARIVPIEEPTMATTTTEYGSWNTQSGTGVDTVAEAVAAALGEFAGDYDVEAIAEEYEAAINAALPDGVSLNGSEFYGPYPKQSVDIRTIVEGVDFWEIVAEHEK